MNLTSTLQKKIGKIELPFDDILYSGEYEEGHNYRFKVTYFDGHVEYGNLRYMGKIVNPEPIPGSNEHMVIPEFLSIPPYISAGYAKSIERVS